MTNVRARGQGTKLKNGSWRVRAEVVDKGKLKVKNFTAKTLAKAQGKKDAYFAKYGGYAAPKSVTLKEYADGWIQRVEGNLAPKTVRFYKTTLKHLEAIGHKQLSRITPPDLENVLPLDKPRTAHAMRTVLGTILQDAMREGLITVNIARLSRAPKYERKERRVLDRETLGKILVKVENVNLKVMFKFLAGTGLRPAEAIGLIWPDLFKEEDGWWLTLRHAKTQAARKPRPLAESLVNELSEIRGSSVYVFATSNGTPYMYRNVVRTWVKACEDAKVGSINLYQLRKMRLTEIAATAPRHLLKEFAGHTDARTTEQFYTRADKKDLRGLV